MSLLFKYNCLAEKLINEAVLKFPDKAKEILSYGQFIKKSMSLYYHDIEYFRFYGIMSIKEKEKVYKDIIEMLKQFIDKITIDA